MKEMRCRWADCRVPGRCGGDTPGILMSDGVAIPLTELAYLLPQRIALHFTSRYFLVGASPAPISILSGDLIHRFSCYASLILRTLPKPVALIVDVHHATTDALARL